VCFLGSIHGRRSWKCHRSFFDGTAESYDSAELLGNDVLKVSKTASPAREGQSDSVLEVTYYSPHAWIAVTPSMSTQKATKRGLYI
jgi:hypothetical protein